MPLCAQPTDCETIEQVSAALAGLSTDTLNNRCFCIRQDPQALQAALADCLHDPALFALVQARCPQLFAAQPVFVARNDLARMAAVVQAVEEIVALPAYRDLVLERAPAIARHDPGGAKGVFFGFDFHVASSGPGLIEINTNAGGAMLNGLLARAQRACCPAIEQALPAAAQADELERQIHAMFHAEWHRSGHTRPLHSIAIVDDTPTQQHLYPEFLLFQHCLTRLGLHVVIADPTELAWRAGKLWHGDQVIDLVYNRLTDFMLEEPAHADLRSAYLDHAVVLTPHPQAHALYADKRNLALLSQPDTLRALGVSAETAALLQASIPHTEVVTPANADMLWQNRRRYFFKPWSGFASRATYRGDKLTQRVWQEILAGDYVAQALVAPGQRVIAAEADAPTLKFDVRNYTYDGQVQWVAARLYQGQTTNFRTPGGGFAPVYPGPATGMGA